MEKVLKLIGYLFSYIWTPQIKQILNSISMRINTGYYSRFIKIGKNSLIAIPKSIHNPQYMEIGESSVILEGAILSCVDRWENYAYTPNLRIGNNCCIGKNCHITAANAITIEDNVLTGAYVTITDNGHGATANINDLKESPNKRPIYSKGTVHIGQNVWIGDKVTILPGVTIGENSIIGANSVVSRSLPSNSICAGVPAKVLRQF